MGISRRRPAREVKVDVARYEPYRRGASTGTRQLGEVEELLGVLVAKHAQLGPQHPDYLLHPSDADHAWKALTPAGKNHQVVKHEVVRIFRAGERLPVQKYLAGECRPVELAEREETLRHVPYSEAVKASCNSSASTGVAPA